MKALLFCCIAAMLVWGAAPARADTREALIIGNAGYADVPLRNPVNDAQAIDAALRGLGFKTRLVRNVGWREMIQTVQDFVVQTDRADLRLIYYAGHGAQIRGRNVLIPIDAPMNNADELAARSLDANEILTRLARNERGLNLLILDACRSNPANQYQLSADGRRIKVRGAAKGLAAMPPPPGSLVAFSTAPGSVADDGPGRDNSLYARHLLRHIGTPGLTVEQLFKRVRIGVLQESAQRQRPWEESSLTVDYCLVANRNISNRNGAACVAQ